MKQLIIGASIIAAVMFPTAAQSETIQMVTEGVSRSTGNVGFASTVCVETDTPNLYYCTTAVTEIVEEGHVYGNEVSNMANTIRSNGGTVEVVEEPIDKPQIGGLY